MVVFSIVLPQVESPGVESLRLTRILKHGEEEEINTFDFVVVKDSIWIWIVWHCYISLTLLLYH